MGEGLLTLFYQQPSEVSGMSGTGDGVLSNKTSRLQVLSHSVQQGSSQTSVGKSCFERQIDRHINPQNNPVVKKISGDLESLS